MTAEIPEVPALDEFDGDVADQQVGEEVEPEHDLHLDGIVSKPSDFIFPEVNDA